MCVFLDIPLFFCVRPILNLLVQMDLSIDVMLGLPGQMQTMSEQISDGHSRLGRRFRLTTVSEMTTDISFNHLHITL
jgi:hypothetical protein